ncbi:MAG TPA: thiopurine S-methyltransferase [Kofleriaceae bacterium]|nr:thiopurine S-methyltransferase [Kofleriaceae bacterium]
MDHGFWIERWREGKIGFHEGQPNSLLERHVERLGVERRVLVPLCGKSDDLAFLAGRGHSVVGAELVEDAVRAFFSEHAITPTVTRRGEHVEYTADAITIFAGDFFTLSPALVGPIDAFYDRAALVALPRDQRREYVDHLYTLLAPGSRGLLITFEYPDGAMTGPPFSVPEAEVRTLHAGTTVEVLERRRDPRDRLPEAIELCYAVQLPRASQNRLS